MAAECNLRFRIILMYVVQRHSASLIFNPEETMRTGNERGRCDSESQPRICAGIEEGIHQEGAELGFLVLHSKVQWCLPLDVSGVDVAARFEFQ